MENKKIPFRKTFFTIIASAIIGIVLSGLTTLAAPPTNKYAPGETLTPNCLPGSTNCTIVPLAASGANTDITSLSSLATTTWSTGAAITAASYQIGRDADATNQLHFNVPTGAGYEWSVNDTPQATLSATSLNVQDNTIDWSTGATITAASYQIGRDADATNQLHFNVPTGAGYEWSVNDVAQATLSATSLNVQDNTIDWSTGAAITAASYQIGRDADATNQLHFNVPTGAGYEWSVNDTARVTSTATSPLTITQAAATTGNPFAFNVTSGAHTTLTNSDQIEAQFELAPTKQFTGAAGATTIDLALGLSISRASYSTAGAGATTITNAASFYITGAPLSAAGGGGTTITNAMSIWTAGKVRFDGGGTSGQASAAGGLLEMKASTINGNNASGTIAIGTPVSLGITTYTNNNATLTMTNAASLYIAGIPVASTNVAFTQAPYALWVDAGNTRLDGTILQGVATSTGAAYLIEQSVSANTSWLARSTNTSNAGQHLFQMLNDGSKDIQFGIYGSAHSNTWGRNNGFFFTTNDMLLSTNDTVPNGGANSIKFGTGGYDMSTQVRMELNSSGYLLHSYRHELKQGVDVTSANDLVLGADGNVFEITGTTQINHIASTGWQNGSKVTLVFNENVTVANAQATSGANITILLAGAVNFAATANDTLTLVLSETTAGGQAWREEARSVI